MRSALFTALVLFASQSAFAGLSCTLFNDGETITKKTYANDLVMLLGNVSCVAEYDTANLSLSLSVASYERSQSSQSESVTVDNGDAQCSCTVAY